MISKRANDAPSHVAGQAHNKFKVAASTFMIFRKLGINAHHFVGSEEDKDNHHSDS